MGFSPLNLPLWLRQWLFASLPPHPQLYIWICAFEKSWAHFIQYYSISSGTLDGTASNWYLSLPLACVPCILLGLRAMLYFMWFYCDWQVACWLEKVTWCSKWYTLYCIIDNRINRIEIYYDTPLQLYSLCLFTPCLPLLKGPFHGSLNPLVL